MLFRSKSLTTRRSKFMSSEQEFPMPEIKASPGSSDQLDHGRLAAGAGEKTSTSTYSVLGDSTYPLYYLPIRVSRVLLA